MVLTFFSLRRRNIFRNFRKIFLLICILIIIISLKLLLSNNGNKGIMSFYNLDPKKYISNDETVEKYSVNDYDDIMIGLDEVNDLDTLSDENYNYVKKQLLEETKRMIDMEPLYYDKLTRSVDHLELEFLLQYARDVESGKRGSELEQEWQWAKDISIVYTWINGTDDALMERKSKYNGGIKKADNRDRCIDELRYSLRSLYKYLPWHKGTIYIVTPGQTPVWLDTNNPRIKVIDQEDILPKQTKNGTLVNPTFNSFAIEWFLDRIPGVSEQFIQLNDEYFFRRPVHPAFFFFGGGEGYINNKKVKEYRIRKSKKNKNNNKDYLINMKKRQSQNEEEEEEEEEEEHYVHGVKIDKDIQELVAEELKKVNSKEKRSEFIGKRNPINVEEDDEEGEVDDDIEAIDDDDNENYIPDSKQDTEENARREREQNRIKFFKDKGYHLDSKNNKNDNIDDGENPDDENEYQNNEEEYVEGEMPDNEDEGIGIISKNKQSEKVVLMNEDFKYKEDGSISIFRTENIPTRKPYINKYIYPNAAKYYRFPNVYLSDKFITLSFEKSRSTFNNKNARWIDKFYGSMAMTNGVIAEDLEQSTLVNMLEHSPYVYYRDLFEMARQRYAQYVDLVVGHRFRTAMDFVPPYAQSMYLRLHASQPGFEEKFDQFYDSVYIHDIRGDDDSANYKRKRSILKYGFHIVDFNIKNLMIRFGAVYDDIKRNNKFFKEIIKHKTLIFFNLNDDYNIPEAAEQFSHFMQILYPEPSIFEREGY
ncbi:hypothetical protein BCR36DRAFT_317719 [Piromyces finnis]|uniref:Stealth protein CR2 conserved region 2 domain-containing protein n=1 Tax=Piromyces finnis TaxID=1754191 RepID=A0A1Y1VKY0_9FUNG|nr:hypothetical protein BCR36DRAFT_317719 [Piromyces finnis]|eukprot:ORX58418.1 hypothetical protein BCR36DRAFT_317719 [Piromyces finnis]